MDSIQSRLWRDMAKEAMVVADQVKDNPGLQREMLLMAARYMAMAEMVEIWTQADQADWDRLEYKREPCLGEDTAQGRFD
jgi:hypothetical protein